MIYITQGYLFAGAQYGRECFCGNSYGKYGQGTSCYIKCSGDPYQNCGGSRQNTVMTTGMCEYTLLIIIHFYFA